MTEANHALARAYFAALSNGDVPDDLLTPDMTCWTTTSGTSEKARFQGGIRLFASLFSDPLTYTVDSLTAEDDRVAAEVQSRGTLSNGEAFHNVYIFMLRIRDGRIASVAEHFNPRVIEEKVMPLMMAKMGKGG